MSFPRTEQPLFRLPPCEGRDPSFCCSQTWPGLQRGFTCVHAAPLRALQLSGMLGGLEVLCRGAAVPCRRAEDQSVPCRFFLPGSSLHVPQHLRSPDCRKRQKEIILKTLPGHPAPPAGSHPAAVCSCSLPRAKLPLCLATAAAGGETKSEQTAPGPLAARPIKMAPCPSLR